MKKLKIGQTVYLENNREYAVANIVKKDNKEYAYLVTITEPFKVKFAEIIYNNDTLDLDIVTDNKLKEDLLVLFQEKIKDLNL